MKKDQLLKMLGSFARVFMYVILAYVIEHKSIFNVDWIRAVDAATIGSIAVIINYFNPADSRYGPADKFKQDEKSS
jgi:hypothetical protein